MNSPWKFQSDSFYLKAAYFCNKYLYEKFSRVCKKHRETSAAFSPTTITSIPFAPSWSKKYKRNITYLLNGIPIEYEREIGRSHN